MPIAETTSGAATEDSVVLPIPPRYWWLKRIAIAISLLLVALFALRLWWGWTAYRRLEYIIAQLVADGTPIFPEDFDSAPVPDNENAAFFLNKAVELRTHPDGVAFTLARWRRSREEIASHLDDVRLILEANEAALTAIRQARGKSRIDWHVRFRSPVSTQFGPNVMRQGSSIPLLMAAIHYHHISGESEKAIEYARDLLAMSAAVDQASTTLAHLSAVGIQSRVVYWLQSATPTLTIADDTGDSLDGPATRRAITELIEVLRNDDGLSDGLVQAIHCESMWTLDDYLEFAGTFVEFAGRGKRVTATPTSFLSDLLGWPLRPLFALDTIATMDYFADRSAAAVKRTYDAELAAVLADAEQRGWVDGVRQPLSSILLPSYGRSFLLHFRALARRRMATIVLAIRLYELDHDRRPATLTNLIPKYIREIPRDPFASDGRAIAYHPNDDPPILYSVSENGVDGGGAYTTDERGYVDRNPDDLPFFLNGQSPKGH